MPPLYLLIKPASSACQLKCQYCFYYDVANHREVATYEQMSEDTLEVIIKKALKQAQGFCVFAYQGGEPTLRGLDFFKKAIEFEQLYNVKNLPIYHMIQTNGMTINEEWATFFKAHQFLVGISLDGTEQIHNAYRVDHQNRPTFNRVLKSIQLLDAYQVDYNILTVLTATAANKIHQIYEFYKEQGFKHLQFIPCLDSLDANASSSEFTLTAKQYGDCLVRLYQLWEQDLKAGHYVSIRLFDNWLRMLQGHAPESCGMSGICGMQYVIEGDGTVYPCDFYVLDDYVLGSLLHHSFEEIDEVRKAMAFIESSYPVATRCQQCDYFKLCRGGCRRNREVTPKELGLNEYCESYRFFFDKQLKNMIEVAKVIR